MGGGVGIDHEEEAEFADLIDHKASQDGAVQVQPDQVQNPPPPPPPSPSMQCTRTRTRNEWVDAWMHGCMDGWMHRWMDGQMDAWMHACMHDEKNG